MPTVTVSDREGKLTVSHVWAATIYGPCFHNKKKITSLIYFLVKSLLNMPGLGVHNLNEERYSVLVAHLQPKTKQNTQNKTKIQPL